MNIKICGLVNEAEIYEMDSLGIQYGGICYGIPNGRYNLPKDKYRDIVRLKTKYLKLVLVTLEKSFHVISTLLDNSSIAGIQLHGFQLPSIVKKIKSKYGKSIMVFKVLHIRDNICIEENLIDRYLEGGTDYFILDTFLSKAQIGSTGVTIQMKIINDFLSRVGNEKVIIAGGINEQNIVRICKSFRPFGVDIDSSVRENGHIDRQRVCRLIQALSTYCKKTG